MERDHFDALEAGDPEVIADAEHPLGIRRNDPVGDWPGDKLHLLIEARPDLLGELIRRRPSEVQQA